MATTYAFGFSNTTGATTKVTPVDLKMVTNYAKTTDEPTEAVLSNKTCSMEQPEVITYKSRRLNKLEGIPKVYNPAPVTSGVSYQIRVDDILRVTDDSGKVIDEPISMWLNIMHPATNSWTNARVASILTRLIGACQSSDGASYRFEDIMKSALVPTAD